MKGMLNSVFNHSRKWISFFFLDEIVLFYLTLVWTRMISSGMGFLWKYLFDLRNTLVQLQVPHNPKLRAARVILFPFLSLSLTISFARGEMLLCGGCHEMSICFFLYSLHLVIFSMKCMCGHSIWGWGQQAPTFSTMQNQHTEMNFFLY